MNAHPLSIPRAAWPLALSFAPGSAGAQTRQAEKELARPVRAGTLQACSLIARADVQKATGRDPYADPEPAGQGGWVCNVGIAELKVYSGPKSTEAWELTMKGFKMDKQPRTPVSGFGEGAHFLFFNPNQRNAVNLGFLIARSTNHTLALSVDAPEGKPAKTARPALESLMKSVVARVRDEPAIREFRMAALSILERNKQSFLAFYDVLGEQAVSSSGRIVTTDF